MWKLLWIFFLQLEMVNHLFEAGLSCLPIWAVCLLVGGCDPYFNHLGSVPHPPCGDWGIPCLCLLQLFEIFWKVEACFEILLERSVLEVSMATEGSEFLLCYGLIWACHHLLGARIALYQVTWIRREGNESPTAPSSQLSRCGGSLDVSAMSHWSKGH